ncbi:AEC family transporter [Methylobrevis pamukkalensis]|uniref:Membrane transport protein n=1 Tax=Methylobrevis pamukkalensis TaxID=1439726 RepID=A0A1E3H8D2_9HYPH|nr:AEC family transporter [Methylobrevis pamukkalensis]ODN72056.1 Membrane transport protein [Methylobrevis pamukkalensis]
MSQIADNVLPIFALIAIGYIVVAIGLLKAEIGDGLGDFVFKLGVPVLLFRTIVYADFQGASPWTIWCAYFTGVLVSWTLGHLVVTRLFGRDRRAGVLAGVASAFANTVFIALPLVNALLGEIGLVAVTILLSVHLPVMMIAGTLLMERAERQEAGGTPRPLRLVLAQVGRNLVRNPLVIGLLFGVVFHLFGITLSGPAEVVTSQLAGMAGPAALVSMGMALRKYGLSGQLGPAFVISGLKLVLMPAVTLVVARLLGLDPAWTAALVLTAAVPTGVNAYLIANHFGVGHGLASSVITLSTALGAVTVSIWALLLTG